MERNPTHSGAFIIALFFLLACVSASASLALAECPDKLLFAGPDHLGDTTNPLWVPCGAPAAPTDTCLTVAFELTAEEASCLLMLGIESSGIGFPDLSGAVYMDDVLLGYLNENVGSNCDFNETSFLALLEPGNHIFRICASPLTQTGYDDFIFKNVHLRSVPIPAMGSPDYAYSLDDGSGNVVVDHWGDTQGTIHGNVEWVQDGAFSFSSLRFFGQNDDYVATAIQPIIGLEHDFVLDFAARHTVDDTVNVLHGDHAFGVEMTGQEELSFRFRPADRHGVFFLRDNAHNVTDLVTPGPINDGEWHRYRIVRNAPERLMRMWMDGVLVDARIDNFVTAFAPHGPLDIGNSNHAIFGHTFGWHGDVDELKFYRSQGSVAVQVDAATPKAGFRVAVRPNPLRRSGAHFEFSLSEPSSVTLRIYAVTGRLLREIREQVIPAGAQSIAWDGRDQGGRHVVSGVYTYVVDSDVASYKGKLTVLK
ncbi:MAG: FlgD immunoglobulin-like domain containing protein [Dehalococcoidia bacterium]